jgi:hypothetical protein
MEHEDAVDGDSLEDLDNCTANTMGLKMAGATNGATNGASLVKEADSDVLGMDHNQMEKPASLSDG